MTESTNPSPNLNPPPLEETRMKMETATWAAVSGAVLCVFWPWIVAGKVMELTLGKPGRKAE